MPPMRADRLPIVVLLALAAPAAADLPDADRREVEEVLTRFQFAVFARDAAALDETLGSVVPAPRRAELLAFLARLEDGSISYSIERTASPSFDDTGRVIYRSRHALATSGRRVGAHELDPGEFVLARETPGGPWRIVSTNADSILPPEPPRRQGARELLVGALLLGSAAIAWALLWRLQRERLAAERVRPGPPPGTGLAFAVLALWSLAGLAFVLAGVFRLVRPGG